MNKVDRFRSPAEVERLENLKRDVDLVALATERYGYSIKEQNRERTSHVLENGAGDKLIVQRATEGWQKYFNATNDQDKGSVVDFLQYRNPGKNLGQIKGMLGELAPGGAGALDYERLQQQPVGRAASASEERYQAMPAGERRAAMVRDTVGESPRLTDTSYLLERGLTRETVNDPAFQGRVFTDQHPDRARQHNVGFPFYNNQGIQSWELRNRAAEGEEASFKLMMKAPGDQYGAKNGVWSSNLLEGRGSQPDRLVLGESPIDMMSKYQTERATAQAAGEQMPNTRYVATGGTPSMEQKAIIQELIDREKPRQIALSNDNDVAGQAFNVRYLNDLRPPQATLSPEVQQQAQQARDQVSWIAGDNGKKLDEKLMTMTITFKHDPPALPGASFDGPGGENVTPDNAAGAERGRNLVAELRAKVAERGLPAEEPQTTQGIGLEMRRNAPHQTEVVLRVPPGQANEVVELARDLRQEREARLPLEARTPEGYFAVERANGKDYNQDILQAQADSQLAAARERAGFTEPAVAPQVSPELERFVSRPDVAAAIAQEREERAREQTEPRTATLLVLDPEPRPYVVGEKDDDRARTLANDVWANLEKAGASVQATELPKAQTERDVVATQLQFEYTPGSETAVRLQQVVADVVANGDNRVMAVGIEPAAQAQADVQLGGLGRSVQFVPVALTSEEGSATLEARLRAGGLSVVPAQIEQEPGVLVLLERGNAREAAILEKVVGLHENENEMPLTVRQSAETARERQEGVTAYYDPERGANARPPELAAAVIIQDVREEDRAVERLTNVGATLTELPAAGGQLDTPTTYRVEYPLDEPAVAANVSHVLSQLEVASEASWDREARQEIARNQGEPRIDIELIGRTDVAEALAVEEAARSQARLDALEASPEARRQASVEDELQSSMLENAVMEPTSRARDLSADIDSNSATSPEELFQAEVSRDGIATPEARRQAAVEDELQSSMLEDSSMQPTNRVQGVSADIDNNGSTSAEEIIRADINRDGVVSESELREARFEAAQEQPRQAADLNGDGVVTEGELATVQLQQAEPQREQAEKAAEAERQAETERQATLARQRQEEQQREEGTQQTQAQRSNNLASAVADSTESLLVHRGEEKSAEAVAATVLVLEAVPMWPGSLAEGNDRFQSYGERVREALEQAGATVTELPVRDPETGRPATELRFEYQPGSPEHSELSNTLRSAMERGGGVQLTGIAAGELVEEPSARLSRTIALDQMPLAIAMREPQPELEANLRATGAEVINETVLGRPGLVVLVNERDASQLSGIERTLAEKPGGTAILEAPETMEARLQAALTLREQGKMGQAPEVTPARTMPEPRETTEHVIPKSQPEIATVATAAEVTIALPTAAEQVRGGVASEVNLTPDPHAVERRITVDIPTKNMKMDEVLEKAFQEHNFAIVGKQAVGEGESSATRIQLLYLTTDAVAEREKQAAMLKTLNNDYNRERGVVVYEPEGQAKERAADLKAPGQPDKKQLVAAGQNLRANISVIENEQGQDGEQRVSRLWQDLKKANVQVGHIVEATQEQGSRFSFPIQYSPTNAKLGEVNSILSNATKAEGIQVTESDNNRLERLARVGAREDKAAAERGPEAQEKWVRPAGPDYSPAQPAVYAQLALTSEEFRKPAGITDLKEQLKGTEMDVAIRHRDGQPAGGATITISYLETHPKREAVEEVLRNFSEKGGQVYDLKNRTDFEAGREVAPVQALPETPAQAQAKLAEEIRELEALRETLRASQREATRLSEAAEQQLTRPEAGALAAVVERDGVKPWVAFGPDLRGEDMRNTDATNMDLRGSNMAGLDLRTTDLQNSDLRDANLTNADLRGVNLTGVKLEGAVLDGAQLDKAFRVVENADGRRSLEDNLTPAQLSGPERGTGATPAPVEATPVAVEATVTATAAAPQAERAVEEPAPATRATATTETEATIAAPSATAAVPGAAPAQATLVTGESVFSLPTEAEHRQSQAQATLPMPQPQLTLDFSLPTEAEHQQSQASAREAAPVPVEQRAAAEAAAPAPSANALSLYEQQEEAGKALHTVSITVTQPIWTEASGVPLEQAPDRVQEVLDRVRAAGTEIRDELRPSTIDEAAKTETNVLTFTYAQDDRNLPALHRALGELDKVPAGSDYQVSVSDANAEERAKAVAQRPENTQEAAKAMAADLHDGNPTTARLLIERPSLEDVWALQAAGAAVERVYLPEGPAAKVSYPIAEPAVTGPISIELDRIDRDSRYERPPHNSNEREISGGLLGEDPAQQQQRQAQAVAENLSLEPRPRYELHEMSERDARAKSYFQDETLRPSDPMSGKVASGEQWTGNLQDVLRLEAPDRQALHDSWAQQKTSLEIIVQEAPGVLLPGRAQAENYPERVAEALRQAGAETKVESFGVSPDTGLERSVVRVDFPNNSPELGRIQATLGRVAEEGGVTVPADGYWQREQLLGPNGSRLAEPVLAERARPWLEASVAVASPTLEERRNLTRAGARLEETELPGHKPAIVAYYDLDNPTAVAKVGGALEKASLEGRVVGEAAEAREARMGRVEQHQLDVRQEKEQTTATWQDHVARFPKKLEPFIGEEEKTSFADRLRQAVSEHLSEFKKGWEAGRPENVAIYAAEQRGIRDRMNGEQHRKEQEGYDRGFKGETVAPGTPGTPGVAAEVRTDQTLRERRDDERSIPVKTDGPTEGKVLETKDVVKPGIAAQAGTPAEKVPAEADKTPTATPNAAAAVVPAATEVTPAATRPQVQLREAEWQHGIILTNPGGTRTAEERITMMRDVLLAAGASVGNVAPPPPGQNAPAALVYSYNPEMKDLDKVNEALERVQQAKGTTVQEEPHHLQNPKIAPGSHEVPREHWPEREGQFNQAKIVIDEAADSRGRKGEDRAERIRQELRSEGAAVSEVKSDGHGHVEMSVSFHTHTPQIEKINSTLDRAGEAGGIEVRETAQDRGARYQGAVDIEQSRNNGREQERDR